MKSKTGRHNYIDDSFCFFATVNQILAPPIAAPGDICTPCPLATPLQGRLSQLRRWQMESHSGRVTLAPHQKTTWSSVKGPPSGVILTSTNVSLVSEGVDGEGAVTAVTRGVQMKESNTRTFGHFANVHLNVPSKTHKLWRNREAIGRSRQNLFDKLFRWSSFNAPSSINYRSFAINGEEIIEISNVERP